MEATKPPKPPSHSPPPRPDPVPLIDALERAYDGAPPRLASAVARAGGRDAYLERTGRAARSRAHRDCAEARLAASRRRAMLTGGQVLADPWLRRLTDRLALSRTAALPPPPAQGRQ